jgi:hypothetical protein
VKPGRCCGTTRTWFSRIYEMRRGNPPRLKRSRMVYHVLGEQVFWHWFDQKGKLGDLYGFGPHLQPYHERIGR